MQMNISPNHSSLLQSIFSRLEVVDTCVLALIKFNIKTLKNLLNVLMKFFVTIVSMLFFQSLAAKDLNKEITSFKVYDQLIALVFEARCQNCHGENKDMGS